MVPLGPPGRRNFSRQLSSKSTPFLGLLGSSKAALAIIFSMQEHIRAYGCLSAVSPPQPISTSSDSQIRCLHNSDLCQSKTFQFAKPSTCTEDRVPALALTSQGEHQRGSNIQEASGVDPPSDQRHRGLESKHFCSGYTPKAPTLPVSQPPSCKTTAKPGNDPLFGKRRDALHETGHRGAGRKAAPSTEMLYSPISALESTVWSKYVVLFITKLA